MLDPRKLEHKLVSKKDWYEFLKFNSKPASLTLSLEGYLLPSYKKTTMRFLRDVLSGKKDLLKAANTMPFNVPKFPELSVEKVFNAVKDNA